MSEAEQLNHITERMNLLQVELQQTRQEAVNARQEAAQARAEARGRGQEGQGGQGAGGQGAEVGGLRLWKQALNHLPRFSGGEGRRFREHALAFTIWTEVEEVGDDNRLKKALIFSLTGEALKRVRSVGIGTPTFEAANTWQDYLGELFQVFEPDSEKQLARLEFEQLKQGREEDIGSYLAAKWEAFVIAYPGPEVPPFSFILGEVVKGLWSPVIRRLVTRSNPQNQQELRTSCLLSVSTERTAYANGFSESTSLDGLASVSRTGRTERGTAEPRRDETPMEVDAISGNCYICGTPGHLARECPKKAAAPQSGGQARGGPGARTPFRGKCFRCNRVGHTRRECRQPKVQQLEEETEEDLDEDEVYNQEEIGNMTPVPFLGEGRVRRRTQW